MTLEPHQTSPTYQLIVLNAKRSLVASQLFARMGPRAEPLIARVHEADGESVEQAGLLVAKVGSDDELLARLDAVLPRPAGSSASSSSTAPK